MKRLVLIFYIAVIVLNAGCKKSAIASNVPACIKNEIENNKDRNDWYIGNVEEYRFQDKLVYAFNSGTRIVADGGSEITTDDCNVLCGVGGFGGPAINLCNGENFIQ